MNEEFLKSMLSVPELKELLGLYLKTLEPDDQVTFAALLRFGEEFDETHSSNLTPSLRTLKASDARMLVSLYKESISEVAPPAAPTVSGTVQSKDQGAKILRIHPTSAASPASMALPDESAEVDEIPDWVKTLTPGVPSPVPAPSPAPTRRRAPTAPPAAPAGPDAARTSSSVPSGGRYTSREVLGARPNLAFSAIRSRLDQFDRRTAVLLAILIVAVVLVLGGSVFFLISNLAGSSITAKPTLNPRGVGMQSQPSLTPPAGGALPTKTAIPGQQIVPASAPSSRTYVPPVFVMPPADIAQCKYPNWHCLKGAMMTIDGPVIRAKLQSCGKPSGDQDIWNRILAAGTVIKARTECPP